MFGKNLAGKFFNLAKRYCLKATGALKAKGEPPDIMPEKRSKTFSFSGIITPFPCNVPNFVIKLRMTRTAHWSVVLQVFITPS